MEIKNAVKNITERLKHHPADHQNFCSEKDALLEVESSYKQLRKYFVIINHNNDHAVLLKHDPNYLPTEVSNIFELRVLFIIIEKIKIPK